MLSEKVNLDLTEGEITFPKVFSVYKEDFGGSEEEMLRYILRYLPNENEIDDESLIKEVCIKKNILIRFN